MSGLRRGLCLLAVALCALGATGSARATGSPVRGPVHRAGRWLVDDQGRVVVLHGFNVMRKIAPFVPDTFSAADARLLATEGFTAARIGFIWQAVEPSPGHYDDAYIRRVLALDRLLGRYGIRTLLDFHQDVWSSGAAPGLGDGAPAWADLGPGFLEDFAAFWHNQAGPGGVGIQTRFARAWEHVARMLRSERNIVGLDPFNEPYAGSDNATCGLFAPCPRFERGALAAFYRRVIRAIRAGGARQVIFPEGIADNGIQPPALPASGDPQTGVNFHFYCSATQLATRVVPVGVRSPLATGCAPIERRGIATFTRYANRLDRPAFLSEFSCNDVDADNAQIVDIAGQSFTAWTAWAYYTAADEPADCPRQGLLVSDARPASERNAKQNKLDALAVPYAVAIAGQPVSTRLDRVRRRFTLTYRAAAVPGARLRAGAPTIIFVPARMYRHGYVARVSGGRVTSGQGARWLAVRATPGDTVTVTVRP